jgi:hypothetical protein
MIHRPKSIWDNHSGNNLEQIDEEEGLNGIK